MESAGSWILWVALGAAVIIGSSQGFLSSPGGAKFERPGGIAGFF